MRKALIDANLVVLLVVGSLDISLIKKHQRTEKFAKEDFATLARFLEAFGSIASTPHALAEASNLLGQFGDPVRTQLFCKLRQFVSGAIEVYVPSVDAAAVGCFERLGLADGGLAKAALDGLILVTVDFGLYNWLSGQNIEVYNFNHIRVGAWGATPNTAPAPDGWRRR